MKILVTGGAGYIGSHTAVELLNIGHDVIIVDNLCNSNSKVIQRIKQLTKRNVPFYNIDIRDRDNIFHIMSTHNIDVCIHFAGLKSVGESVQEPILYYDNNVNGTICLLDVMKSVGCKNIIFSSSATVYGENNEVPYLESSPRGICTNPYAQSKSIIEQILTDLQKSDPDWNVVLLRYFNPIGAHSSGKLGDNPKGIPNNLMPYITQVAIGRQPYLNVFGNDYDTPDGTGIRDYIHIMDLATGHVSALQMIDKNCGMSIYNLGTGKGYSVLEIIRTFEVVNQLTIPYNIQPRRPGDLSVCWADVSKAWNELGWKAKYNIEDMCRDAWNWQKNNPNGFD